jgi:hypothetical protein
MENRYWIGRKRSAMGMARGAATAEARLIHYDLAGRYSVMAVQALSLAAASDQRAIRGEGAALRLPQPQPCPPAPPRLGRDGEGS